MNECEWHYWNYSLSNIINNNNVTDSDDNGKLTNKEK